MRKTDKYDVVVVHPFQQHSFKTATAVAKAGYSTKYITTVYNKPGSITQKGISILSGSNKSRALSRHCDSIEDDSVIQYCELSGLLLLLLQRIDKSKKVYSLLYRKQIQWFNRKVLRFLKNNSVDAVIVYDVLSADLIEGIRKSNLQTKIILDMSAPYYNYMEMQYSNDAEKYPEISENMLSILDSKLYSYRREYSKYEIENADYYLVASEFTKKSLEYGGVKGNILLCEYGIDDFIDLDQKIDCEAKKSDEKINIIFVGSITQQKGAYQIFRVLKYLSSENFHFDFYGNVDMNSKFVKDNMEYCTFHGHIPRNAMIQAYQKADFLLLPTLADGYGFVVPEALANGVPVIVSKNAGSSQLIKNGINGFVFDVGDDKGLVEILQHIEKNRKMIFEMKNNAVNTVKDLTWDKYNKTLNNYLHQVLNNEIDK